MNVIPLSDITAGSIDLVGGKATGLGRLIAAGEHVPEGFCLTTEAFAEKRLPRAEIAEAYAELGEDVPVAVRSSATAEDLPWASFAGQQDTVLNVTGVDNVCTAIETCWGSLDSGRARAYREANNVAESRMAVIVQRMVPPTAAGVLFTANPITGCRTEMVVDAAPGLGTAVVDGSTDTDHYVLDTSRGLDQPRDADHGCLDHEQLTRLEAAGARVQATFGSPQDIEWAFDEEGALWLLQSRAITNLFPVPAPTDDGPRAYLEVGHMQGMLRPFTPMGRSVMDQVTRQWFEAFGARPGDGPSLVTYIGERMYIDLTSFIRSARMRSSLPRAMELYGPRVARAVEWICDDPRFGPTPTRLFSFRNAARIARRLGPPMVRGMVRALRRPRRERVRTLAQIDVVREQTEPPRPQMTSRDRLRFAADVHLGMLTGPMIDSLNPLWTAMLSQQLATGLLAGIAEESDIAAVMRGAPGNVTTEMDLKLWRLADAAREHTELLTTTPSAELVRRFRCGDLPDIGLDEFLAEYGHRAAAEIDVGVPRWEEDPAPIFDAIASYLQVTDPHQAPDWRFDRAAVEAETALTRIVAVAAESRPVRARLSKFLLQRTRALIGLRELPKFLWLFPLRQVRRQLLAVGADLADRGLLEAAADIMFLELDEVSTVLETGADLRPTVVERSQRYEREMRRRQVPGLLLSDGTDVETVLPVPDSAAGLRGTGASPGTVTARARVITNPAGARIEPGEILVAPTTDPGWTPLFMTAAGLVTETGSPMAHGPTVAREYGIPAVICVRDATTAIATGQMITIDGAVGTVELAEAAEAQEAHSVS